MARRSGLVINMGTISEEAAVAEEEVGEDGMVSPVTLRSPSPVTLRSPSPVTLRSPSPVTVPSPDMEGSRQQGNPQALVAGTAGSSKDYRGQDDDSSGDGSSSEDSMVSAEDGLEDLERRNSMVELEDVDVSSAIPAKVLASIVASTKPSTKPEGGTCAPTSATQTTGRWARPASTAKTMRLQGKYVTELTLFDPVAGPDLSACIHLGLFLATDSTMGDHTIYKPPSPCSPFAVVKLRPHERLLKINDLSLEGWSHNCLVNFVRSLPFTNKLVATEDNSSDSTDYVDLKFSLETRPASNTAMLASEAPINRKIDSMLRIRNRRAIFRSVRDSEARVQFQGTDHQRISMKNHPFYLQAHHASTTVRHNYLTSTHSTQGSPECFQVHRFLWTQQTEVGELIMIQTPPQGPDRRTAFLVPHSNHDHTAVSLMFTSAESENVTMVTQPDLRFFVLLQNSGDDVLKIRHYSTRQYLAFAQDYQVRLQPPPEDGNSFPSNMLFELFTCREAEH